MIAVNGRCYRCALAFGDTRADGSEVVDNRAGDGACSRCTPCRDECSCDSEEQHDRYEAESLADFLRNPGPPPKHFTAEDAARAMRGIEAARRERGIK